MQRLRGTETEKNLSAAFLLESQGRMIFSIYGKKLKKEGFVKISQSLLEISEQERAHGSRLFKFFDAADLEMNSDFVLKNTKKGIAILEFLLDFKIKIDYSAFADEAESEGFNAIAIVFKALSNAENHHRLVLESLLSELKMEKSFKKEEEVLWHCIKCGYTYWGTDAPLVCPACAHKQAYFEVLG